MEHTLITPETAATMGLSDRRARVSAQGNSLNDSLAHAELDLWTSRDGAIRTAIQEFGPGQVRTAFALDEGAVIWIAAGHLTVTSDDDSRRTPHPGDAMLFPPGWSGDWTIDEPLRVVLASWQGTGGIGPGAGPALTQPVLRPEDAAALDLDDCDTFTADPPDAAPLRHCGAIQWASADGSIDLGVWEIVPGRFHPTFPRYGEIFRVVSGELHCTPDDGSDPFTLQPGDWMTFPRGWTGTWEMLRPLRKLFVTWTAW